MILPINDRLASGNVVVDLGARQACGDRRAERGRWWLRVGRASSPSAARPTRPSAASDLSISIERLGDFYVQRGQPGDAEQALDQFQRGMQIAQRLYDANPNSAQAARDLSVSHHKLATTFGRIGSQQDAVRHLAGCFAILDAFSRTGRPMDAQMVAVHEQLRRIFAERA